MMPLWLLTLGRTLVDSAIPIPYADIAITLVSLIIPLFLGILLKRFFPKAANVLGKVIRPFMLLMLIAIVVVGAISGTSLLSLVTWDIVVAAMLLPYAGYALGFIIGIVVTRSIVVARTVCIETGMQNSAIALVILLSTFPHPESDIGSILPAVITIMSSIPFVIALIITIIRNRCCKRGQQDQVTAASDEVSTEKEKSPPTTKDEEKQEYSNENFDNEKLEKETKCEEAGIKDDPPEASTDL